jgi:hypothetical protein
MHVFNLMLNLRVCFRLKKKGGASARLPSFKLIDLSDSKPVLKHARIVFRFFETAIIWLRGILKN